MSYLATSPVCVVEMAQDILIILSLTASLSLTALALFGVKRPSAIISNCISNESRPQGVHRLVDPRGAAAIEITPESDISVLIAMGAVTVRRAVAIEDLRVCIRAGRVSVHIKGLPRAKLELAPRLPADWDRIEGLIRALARTSSHQDSRPDTA